MGIALRMVDFNQLHRTANTPPIYVNDIDINSAEQRERLSNMIFTHYEGDVLSIVPRCECDAILGEYNVGVRCDNCGTVVMAVTERPLESILWLKPPKGVRAFISPMMWPMFSARMTFDGVNLFQYLVDPSMSIPPASMDKLPKRFFELNIPRGINHFHDNFDSLMELLFKEDLMTGTRYQKNMFKLFLTTWRHAVFAEALPVPSKLNFITEKTVTSTYVDTTMTSALDALHTISQIDHSITPLNPRTIAGRAMKANRLLADYSEKFISTILVGKKGWWRKHVFGSRLHFTGRAVISSLSDNHMYDELHVPWALAIMLFKIHLTSKLTRRGYTPNQCIQLLHEHSVKYSPVLDELFQELINESPHDGIKVLLNRNPSLVRGSIQTLRITKVKTDPNINSISLSTLVLVQFNADFDGDALNLSLILDDYMYRAAERLEPHHGVLALDAPRKLSSAIKIHAPVIATIANWIDKGR